MSAETPESREGQAPTGPVATAQPTSGGTNGGAPHAPGHAHAHHSTIEFRFLQQLKQRNVIRVGILYLVVCWLILDPVHVLFHMLEVPLWANRLVVILMAMGFPALLLFAWAYEITPEGLKPTTEVDPHRSIRRQTGQRLNRAIVVGLVLAVAYLLADKFWLSKQQLVTEQSTDRLIASPASGVPAIPDKSIAVLPFTDMSEKNDQEYFADGMAEEMVDILAKIPQLKVIGRISSFYFKGQAEDLPTIGEKLGAAYILRGSVRRGGPQIRVTAQLFEARSGAQLWAESYDREFGDVLALQDQIASNIARALQLAVVMDDAQELRRLKSGSLRTLPAGPVSVRSRRGWSARGASELRAGARAGAEVPAGCRGAGAYPPSPNWRLHGVAPNRMAECCGRRQRRAPAKPKVGSRARDPRSEAGHVRL
jgi:TolB-like protein